jgi:hypothetical protein
VSDLRQAYCLETVTGTGIHIELLTKRVENGLTRIWLCGKGIFIAGSVVWTYSSIYDMSPFSTDLSTAESIRISVTV